jgi:hypothetical protein
VRDPNLQRKEILTPDEVMPLVALPSEDGTLPNHLKELKGDTINFAAPRLQVFALNGLRCFDCKAVGEYFGKEKYANVPFYHLNLYAMKNGRETQMLKDYIVLPAKGGSNDLSNMRTVCYDCYQKRVAPAPDLKARSAKRTQRRKINKAKRDSGEIKEKRGEKKPRRHSAAWRDQQPVRKD